MSTAHSGSTASGPTWSMSITTTFGIPAPPRLPEPGSTFRHSPVASRMAAWSNRPEGAPLGHNWEKTLLSLVRGIDAAPRRATYPWPRGIPNPTLNPVNLGGGALTTTTGRAGIDLGRSHATGFIAVALVLCAFGVTGCGVVSAVNKVEHDVQGNKATIDTFTTKIQTGEATAFEATYATTGSSPATVVYAVDPPKGLTFKETPSDGSTGANNVDIVVNSSGEYLCTPSSSSGSGSNTSWSCQKLQAANAADENNIFDFYTPSHWITFLKDFSLAAGIAGDKVTSSTMTVNGFSLQCVDFRAPGVAGISTICTTAQGILGYVKVASDATSFEITSYSSSPPASLFEPPPGATITTPQAGSS